MASLKSFTLLCLAILPLSGCVVSGGGMEEMVDRHQTTNTVRTAEAALPPPPPTDQSDQNTVRNAVSSANLGAADATTMAWANADTGASGVISAIQETRAGNMICRQFQTSRQRYDGVALYRGEACTKGQGEWTLTRFNEGS